MTQAAIKKQEQVQLSASPAAVAKFNKAVGALQQEVISGQITIVDYNTRLHELQTKLVSSAKEFQINTPALVPERKPEPVIGAMPNKPFKDWSVEERQVIVDKIIALAKSGLNDKQIHRELGGVCSLSYVLKRRTAAGLKAVVQKPAKKEKTTPPPVAKKTVLFDDAQPNMAQIEKEARFRERYPERALNHRPAVFNFAKINAELRVSFHDTTSDTWVVLTNKQLWEAQERSVCEFLNTYFYMRLVVVDTATLEEFKPKSGPDWMKAMLHRNYMGFSTK